MGLQIGTAPSFRATTGWLRLWTDYSITQRGFNITSARVCTTRTTQDTTLPQEISSARQPFFGFLYGQDDVVMLKAAPPTSSMHLGIAVKGPLAPNDFDLYVRCGSYPTVDAYDARGYSSDSQEYIDYNIASCYPNWLYIAVHAYRGSGAFTLRLTRHNSYFERDITAGTDFAASEAEMTTLSQTLSQSAKMYFGATEGQHVFRYINFYNNGSCSNCAGAPCDICLLNAYGRSNSGVCSGQINIFRTDFGTPGSFVHEMGHRYYCLGDEYYDVSGMPYYQCGHSMMAVPFGRVHNFCTDLDHKTDAEPGADPSSLVSAHRQAWIAGVGFYPADRITWDNYDYLDFDFNYMVGTVFRR
jgi:hypothetical protein